jgi:hypothetical protein
MKPTWTTKQLQTAFLEAFDLTGGVTALVAWYFSRPEHRSKFYEIMSRLIPRAIEGGAHPIKLEVTNMNELFDRMTQDELLKYAETGALPEWFETEKVEK